MSRSKFSQRSTGIEIMDDLNCAGEVVHQTLRELEFINRMLGGNAVTVSGVKQLMPKKPSNKVTIIDLGCGGGDMLTLLKKSLKAPLQLKGIDANPHIIQYAKEHNSAVDIHFETINILSDAFKKETCDILTATLFFHHFSKEQLIEIFSRLKQQARVGIVVNDLHRHALAFYSIKLLTKLLSKSEMVKFDAPLSVLRGFTREELEEIIQHAGISNFKLNWRWAFRWQLIIRTG